MKNPRSIIARVAREYVGLRETSKNRGPHLDEFWKATGYPDGGENREPWCSAFAAFCVAEGDRREPALHLRKPPAFSAVRDWLPWARRPENGCLIFTPKDVHDDRLEPEPGDIVTYLPHLSHIGIVAKEYEGGGYVATIEGNTGSDGGREGDGVYEKARPLSFCGTFIRVPAVATKA